MIEIRKLDAKDYTRLDKIFRAEFDSDPPMPDNSEIFIAVDDGKFVGFVLAESVVLLGQIYVIPEKRNSVSKIAQNLVSFVTERLDGKATVGTVASEPRFEDLFAHFGMQKVEGVFHRKNIDW